jgi:hypothetical protein
LFATGFYDRVHVDLLIVTPLIYRQRT